jgi:hypothetical protein
MAKKKAVEVKKEMKVSRKGMLVGKPPLTGNSDAWVDIKEKISSESSQGFVYDINTGVATVKVTVDPKGKSGSPPVDVQVQDFDFSGITCRATFASGTYESIAKKWSISDDSPPKKKLFTFEFQFPPGLSYPVALTDSAELVVTVLTKKSTML